MSRSRPQPSARAARRGRSGRGAALVEYVLLLSVFVVAVVYSLDLINEEVEEDASETAYQIGGIPGSTLPDTDGGVDGVDGVDSGDGGGDGGGGVDAGDDAGADDGLATDNEIPVVYAGPDQVVSPSRTVWTTQRGTVSDSDTPAGLLDVTWSASSGHLVRTNRTHVNGDTSIDFRAERPGSYWLTLQADDGYLVGSDTAEIKVTSGIVTASQFAVWGWWSDYRLLSWNARAQVRIINPFGWPISGLTLRGRWTFTTAPDAVVTCTTDGNGWCTFNRSNLSPSITRACFTLEDVTGPAGCFDGWDGLERSACVWQSGLTVPTTTTTTTRPPTTTTTTTRPPTTTRPGGSTTSTTRPPTTTTTRPPTTTTTSTTTTISL